MSKKDLRAIAKHLLRKVLGINVAAKNIEIHDYEEEFIYGIPSYLDFSINNTNRDNYILRELPNGNYKFSVNHKLVRELELSDFEVE